MCSKKLIERIDILFHKAIKLFNKNTMLASSELLKGVTPLEIQVINLIIDSPEATIKSINQDLNIPNSTLTCIINRLEDKQIIKRAINMKDKRSYALRLTDKGVMLQEEHIKMEYALYKSILNAFKTDEERITFIRLAETVFDHFESENAFLHKDKEML